MKMSDTALEAIFEEFGLTEKWIEQGIEQGIERGIEQGIERGIERGEERAKLLIARNLVNMGWGIEDVAKATELDIPKLEGLYRDPPAAAPDTL
jgi:predicted transposase/invertase (TIGR01784 family)